MQLVITREEFAILSDTTKTELIALLGLSLGTDSKDATHVELDDGQSDVAEDLTPMAMKRFMSGVSDKSKKALRIFADSNGETTVHEIEKKFDNDFHWPGFMSGVTRRLRKLTGDTTAIFFQWDESDSDWRNCKVSVSPMTYESLKNYFAIK